MVMCKGCLEDIPQDLLSPDPRYCLPCYNFLAGEATKVKKAGKWVPVRGGPVPDLAIQVGDRIRVSERIDAAWETVQMLVQDNVITNHGEYPIWMILVHEINIEKGVIMTKTAQQNLTDCRTTLAKVMANNADPRVVGLWKSKVAHAEQLCHDVGEAPEVIKEKKAQDKAATNPPAAPKETHLCYCGCGNNANPGRDFLQGHDARLKSYLGKLDKNLLTLEALPSQVQDLIAQNHPIIAQIRAHQ